MGKINCNVIQDLIPSYLDDICSEDTKEIVEEHIAQCKDCRDYLALMKENEFVSEKAEQVQIRYMKKINLHFGGKLIYIFFILLMIIIGGITAIVKVSGNVPAELYYAVLPVMMLAVYPFLGNMSAEDKNMEISGKKNGFLLAVSAALMVFAAGLGHLITVWAKDGYQPFELKAEQMGPFIYYILIGVAVIETVLLIIQVLRGVKQEECSIFVCGFAILGACMALFHISLLKCLNTLDAYMKIKNQGIAVLCTEMMICTAVIVGIKWIFRWRES